MLHVLNLKLIDRTSLSDLHLSNITLSQFFIAWIDGSYERNTTDIEGDDIIIITRGETLHKIALRFLKCSDNIHAEIITIIILILIMNQNSEATIITDYNNIITALTSTY